MVLSDDFVGFRECLWVNWKSWNPGICYASVILDSNCSRLLKSSTCTKQILAVKVIWIRLRSWQNSCGSAVNAKDLIRSGTHPQLRIVRNWWTLQIALLQPWAFLNISIFCSLFIQLKHGDQKLLLIALVWLDYLAWDLPKPLPSTSIVIVSILGRWIVIYRTCAD